MKRIGEIREYPDRLEVIGTYDNLLMTHYRDSMSDAMLRMFDRLLNRRCVETKRHEQFQSHILTTYSIQRGIDGKFWYSPYTGARGI